MNLLNMHNFNWFDSDYVPMFGMLEGSCPSMLRASRLYEIPTNYTSHEQAYYVHHSGNLYELVRV